jgi:hypothetical protein
MPPWRAACQTLRLAGRIHDHILGGMAKQSAEHIEWETLPVALPKGYKKRVHRAARLQALTASAWARMLLIDAVVRSEAEGKQAGTGA